MKRSLFLVTLMGLFGGLFADGASAWREAGHFAVCEIASRHLTPEARQAIDGILQGKDFATQCTWPDMVRHSAAWKHTFPWHFINLDEGQEYYVAGNVNPEGDVLQALLLAEAKLLDDDLPADERLRYLRFLGHMSGDSHQPLHVGHKVDLGGNKIKITWFGSPTFESVAIELAPGDDGTCSEGERYVDEATGECVLRAVTTPQANLHKVWDLLMVERYIDKRRLQAAPGDSEFLHKALAIDLEGKIDPQELQSLIAQPFNVWIEESLQARDQAHAVGNSRLRGRYFRRNRSLMTHRIALAGHRLAFTLNRLFGPADAQRDAEILLRHAELRRQLVELAGETSPLATELNGRPSPE